MRKRVGGRRKKGGGRGGESKSPYLGAEVWRRKNKQVSLLAVYLEVILATKIIQSLFSNNYVTSSFLLSQSPILSFLMASIPWL